MVLQLSVFPVAALQCQWSPMETKVKIKIIVTQCRPWEPWTTEQPAGSALIHGVLNQRILECMLIPSPWDLPNLGCSWLRDLACKGSTSSDPQGRTFYHLSIKTLRILEYIVHSLLMKSLLTQDWTWSPDFGAQFLHPPITRDTLIEQNLWLLRKDIMGDMMKPITKNFIV